MPDGNGMMNDQTLTRPVFADQPVALILGITGSLGGAIALVLARRGYHIRALGRGRAVLRGTFLYPVDWVEGDAMDEGAVISATKGATLIVHAANPPRFQKWREIAIPMLRNVIEAAAPARATILFPANIYPFSDKSPAVVDETCGRIPTTRKGLVRLEMEKMLAEATRTREVRVIIVRSGDFFGPSVKSSWFTQALVKGGRDTKSIKLLTSAGIGHSWAYIPDLAEAFARLVDIRAKLSPFEVLHFGGHYDATGTALTDAVAGEIGRDNIPIRPFPWFSVYLAAPFSPFLREMIEMMWLWKHPLRLDNTKLVKLIGNEPHTPLGQAVSESLGPRSIELVKPIGTAPI
jgi:nucleoside-diphosphate-sugar epimerase